MQARESWQLPWGALLKLGHAQRGFALEEMRLAWQRHALRALPQLALFEPGPDEWRLFMKLPEYAHQKRERQISGITQLLLFPESLASGNTASLDEPPDLLGDFSDKGECPNWHPMDSKLSSKGANRVKERAYKRG